MKDSLGLVMVIASQNINHVMGCVIEIIITVMGSAFRMTHIKEIIGLAMGLVLIGELNVTENAIMGMRHVVLTYANHLINWNIFKIAMGGVFPKVIMKETTGIATGNAHQKVFYVMDIAPKGSSNVVIHVYFLIKLNSFIIAMESVFQNTEFAKVTFISKH